MVPAQMAQCNQVDTLQFVGSLFLTGAALPFLNQEFWIAAAEQAICLSTKGLGPQVRLALRDPYVCIQLQAPSCRQQCFRAAASRPWQELLGSRTFGNEIVRPHFPAFWSAAELGLTASRFNGTRPCRIRSYLSPAPQWVEPPAVELGLRAGRQETGVLGVYHDTGLDFGGAVLYRGEHLASPLLTALPGGVVRGVGLVLCEWLLWRGRAGWALPLSLVWLSPGHRGVGGKWRLWSV